MRRFINQLILRSKGSNWNVRASEGAQHTPVSPSLCRWSQEAEELPARKNLRWFQPRGPSLSNVPRSPTALPLEFHIDNTLLSWCMPRCLATRSLWRYLKRRGSFQNWVSFISICLGRRTVFSVYNFIVKCTGWCEVTLVDGFRWELLADLKALRVSYPVRWRCLWEEPCPQRNPRLLPHCWKCSQTHVCMQIQSSSGLLSPRAWGASRQSQRLEPLVDFLRLVHSILVC